jgi:hypothetical protein
MRKPRRKKNQQRKKQYNMPSGTEQLAVLTQEVQETEGVVDSATTFILGMAQKIADAVAAAMADGLTAAQLQPFSDLGAELKTKSDALAAAIAANGG